MLEETSSWEWMETAWKSSDTHWKDAEHVTVGVDVGSVSSQAVIMADGRMLAYASMRTGSISPDSARRVLDRAMETGGHLPEDRIGSVVGTGYGRVNVPMADRTVTEIACHARGARFMHGPGVRTVLDVGGQDIKVIRCNERGKVSDFLVNDKCAAGTGRGMEVFAEMLDLSVREVGERSFQVQEEPRAVTNECVAYAKSEAAALLRRGWSVESVLAAYCRATAERIFSVMDKLGVEPELAVTGGLAKNRGVMDRLSSLTGLEPLPSDWDPQIAGAMGGALFGHALCQKGKGRRK